MEVIASHTNGMQRLILFSVYTGNCAEKCLSWRGVFIRKIISRLAYLLDIYFAEEFRTCYYVEM